MRRSPFCIWGTIFALQFRLHFRNPMSSLDQATAEQDQWIAQAMEKDESRLRNYIRKHVVDLEAAEDILQDVFVELVEAYRLLKPIEQVSGWLFRVAKNRIIDRFRGRRLESLSQPNMARMTMRPFRSKTCCPHRMADRRRPMRGACCWTRLTKRWRRCLRSSGRSLSRMSGKDTASRSWPQETGVSVNTLLSRKRYAVLHLRRRLQSIYEEFVKK